VLVSLRLTNFSSGVIRVEGSLYSGGSPKFVPAGRRDQRPGRATQNSHSLAGGKLLTTFNRPPLPTRGSDLSSPGWRSVASILGLPFSVVCFGSEPKRAISGVTARERLPIHALRPENGSDTCEYCGEFEPVHPSQT
jgi:hypothetical protein